MNRSAYSGSSGANLGFFFVSASSKSNREVFGALANSDLVVVQHTRHGLNHVKRPFTSHGQSTCAANVLLVFSERQRKEAHNSSAARFGIEFLCGHEKQAEEIMVREDPKREREN
jgi:hypothetical protein